MTEYRALNDVDLLQIRDDHVHRLSQLFDGVPGQLVFVLCGVNGDGQSDLYTKPEKWVAEALGDLESRAEVLRDTAVFRPAAINPWPFGVHFVDTLFGARAYELHGEKDNWQAEYLEMPVGQLTAPMLGDHPSFRLARRLAERRSPCLGAILRASGSLEPAEHCPQSLWAGLPARDADIPGKRA